MDLIYPVASMCFRQAFPTPQALPANIIIINTLVHQLALLHFQFRTELLLCLREQAQVEVEVDLDLDQ